MRMGERRPGLCTVFEYLIRTGQGEKVMELLKRVELSIRIVNQYPGFVMVNGKKKK